MTGFARPGDGETVLAAPAPPLAEDDPAARLAVFAYLAVPVLGFAAPLVVYLMARREAGWLREQAAQALNVWITVTLYTVSATIIGAMLALDSLQVGLAVAGPVVALLWVITLTFLIRAAVTARHGGSYPIPRWLCTPLTR